MKLLNVSRIVLLAGIFVVAGCGLLPKRKEVYLTAEQGKTLAIPPDLDSPSRRDAMRVADAPAVSGPISDKPKSEVQATPDDIADKLFVDATPEICFQNVRDALEQAQIGVLGEIDSKARRIPITVDIQSTEKRRFRKDKVNKQSLHRVVVVLAEGTKSRVVVEDDQGRPVDDEASQRIIAVIREHVSG